MDLAKSLGSDTEVSAPYIGAVAGRSGRVLPSKFELMSLSLLHESDCLD